mgnify:CR=1 FL=1
MWMVILVDALKGVLTRSECRIACSLIHAIHDVASIRVCVELDIMPIINKLTYQLLSRQSSSLESRTPLSVFTIPLEGLAAKR